MPSRRVVYVTGTLALVCGGLVWNVIFDLWLGQVERQYLWEQARHELGLGRAVSLQAMMGRATREAAWVATAWTALIILSIAGAAAYTWRQARK